MLYNLLQDFLNSTPSDDVVIDFFQRIRANQTNGFQLKDAIVRSLDFENTPVTKFTKKMLSGHKDNAVNFLVLRYGHMILQLKSEGFGYGRISKILAKRGGYNQDTGKAYSRPTILRAYQKIMEDLS